MHAHRVVEAMAEGPVRQEPFHTFGTPLGSDAPIPDRRAGQSRIGTRLRADASRKLRGRSARISPRSVRPRFRSPHLKAFILPSTGPSLDMSEGNRPQTARIH